MRPVHRGVPRFSSSSQHSTEGVYAILSTMTSNNRMATGIALGLPFGVVFGMLLDNLALGIAIGLCLSSCFGMIDWSSEDGNSAAED